MIDGRDIRDYKLESLRTQIGIVLQESMLFAVSARDNIAYGWLNATSAAIEAAARLANAHEFIMALPQGYDTILGERGATLSGGERQRIAIARAAVRRAPLLIFDEPTTGLDRENEQAVSEALERLAQGCTTFLIAHDLRTVEQVDLILYLEEGHVVERGTHVELMRLGGHYAAMYRLHTKRTGHDGQIHSSQEVPMLSPLDADLVRRDPTLPGLAVVLDPETFVGALRRLLPDADLGAACVTYVKYKPGTSCLVGYHLTVAGTVVNVYAKAYVVNAAGKLQKAHEKPGQPGALGRGRIPLDDCQVVVSAFPNDAKVRALPFLVEAETRLRLLGQLFPDHPTLWMGAVQGLVYKPERRYVARLLTEDGAQAVLKLYTQPGYDEVIKRYRKPYEARSPLQLALQLSQSDRHAALAFEWLPGRLLSEAILEPQFDAQALVTVGAAIAQLHAQAPEGLPRLTRETEVNTLLSEASVLGLVCPHLTRRAEILARRIAAHLAAKPPAYRLIHGDFHARQVLLHGDTAAILDLDRAACADPMIDLGLFAAHLEREVIRGNLSANRVEPLMQALLEGYTAVTHRPVADEIQLYIAVELLRLAPRFFRYREPDWPKRIEASLGRVEMILAQAAEITRDG
jgi:energy-coupling factor transporter ATP-binding protein EcfA2/aminoglycoside phosphotransferase (APT) family kinase protein